MRANTRKNTPEHCHECGKFSGCVQARNMMPNTQPVPGVVDFDACEHYCERCDADGDGTINQAPLYPAEELDSPAHCGACGAPLACSLTSEGRRYVREAIAEGGGCCRELWPVLFADYLNET